MKIRTILISIFAGALWCGISLAQDTTPPASGNTPPEPQTPATTPSAPAQPAEPSAAQPASPQQPATPAQPSQEQAPATGQPSSQNPGTGTASTPGARRIAPGSVIPVLLTKTVDAKKAKTGDEVVAKVTQDLKTNGGDLLLAKDTKVVGHVTEAQARSKEQKESQLGIAFDRAVMKNGGEMQMPMSIQAIIGPQNNNPNAGGNDQGSAPSASAGQTPAGNAGRSSGMSGSTPPPTASASSGGSNMPTEAQSGTNAAGPITAQTQGVVGISNLKLEAAGQSSTQGSVVTSEKNNVKLESGTMMLLKVNQ